jgi:hypothetical protein
MKRFFMLVRHGYELAGAVSLTIQLAGSGAVGAALALGADLSAPLGIFLAVVVCAAVFAVALALNGRRSDMEARSEPAPERVGIRNRQGGRSTSKRPTFGSGLDTAIENQDGGESQDEDAVFL